MTKIDKIKKKLEQDMGDLPGYYIRDVSCLLKEIALRDSEIANLKTELNRLMFLIADSAGLN